MNDVSNGYPDFTGKCVSITMVDDESSHDLFNATFERQGDRLFIVGTIPTGATESNWAEGCKSAIAWSRVTDYIVFDSLEAYKRGTNTSEQFEKENSARTK